MCVNVHAHVCSSMFTMVHMCGSKESAFSLLPCGSWSLGLGARAFNHQGLQIKFLKINAQFLKHLSIDQVCSILSKAIFDRGLL